VKDHAVVKTLPHEFFKVSGGDRHVAVELDGDVPHRRVEDDPGSFWVFVHD
jgi:hypothetical protein